MSEQHGTRLNAWLCKAARPVVRLLFRYRYDPLSEIPSPYLLLCNHTTDFDPVFLSVSVGHPIRFVASEHITRKGIGAWFLRRVFDPVIHTKGAIGLKTTSAILRTLRGGQTLALFPEGNRCFNGQTCYISPVVAKLAKSSGVSLVTYRLEGGYLSQPRWGSSRRRGRVYGHLAGIYSQEQLQDMSSDDVLSLIRRDLAEDTYASQEKNRVAFRGRNPAEGLESLLFCCPRCGSFDTLVSHREMISCSCGYQARLDSYGYLTEGDQRLTLTDCDLRQREALLGAASNADIGKPLFSDRVTAHRIGSDHSVLSNTSGVLSAFPNTFRFNDRVFSLDEITGAAIHSRNTLTVHLARDSAQYEITGNVYWNALKYIYLFRHLTGTELF